jgi:ribosome maturation factor RimP
LTEGNGSVPFFFYYPSPYQRNPAEECLGALIIKWIEKSETEMSTENQFTGIENKIAELVAEEPGYFIVEVSVKPTNNIKVFIDADQGASIDRLTKLNKALYKWIEENMFPNGDFSIEVSSPGLEEPLKLQRQYVKNIGRNVEVLLNEGMKIEGKLISAADDEIVLEEEKGKGKKKEIIQHVVLKANIKSTKIQIKF